jgi:adenylyltransferase/sulfurtransferase
MPTLRIPTPLRSYTGGQSEIEVQGQTVGDVMQDLILHYPSIRPHLYNTEGELRPFVNLFIGENNIKDLQGLDTVLQASDRLLLIPSIAGGSAVGYAA